MHICQSLKLQVGVGKIQEELGVDLKDQREHEKENAMAQEEKQVEEGKEMSQEKHQ